MELRGFVRWKILSMSHEGKGGSLEKGGSDEKQQPWSKGSAAMKTVLQKYPRPRTQRLCLEIHIFLPYVKSEKNQIPIIFKKWALC